MPKASLSACPTAAVPGRDTQPLSRWPPATVRLTQPFAGSLKLDIPVLQIVADLQQFCEGQKYYSPFKMGN